ncbi:hypothetical protein CO251_04820 [Sulfobacillus sp. hq2]|nr:hypothetical protein CO251_04820 [Sulfobacillus sp. hq2]
MEAMIGAVRLKQWIRFGKELLRRLARDDMPAYAAALAYKFLFALFPLVLFLTALLGFLHIAGGVTKVVRPLDAVIPPAVLHLLQRSIVEAVHHENPTVLSLGIVGFLWGMSGAFLGLMDAFNHAYELPYPYHRSLWHRYSVAIGTGVIVGMLFIAVLVVGTGGSEATRWALAHLLHWPVDQQVSIAIHWILLLVLLVLSLDILYTVLPDVGLRFMILRPGTILATVVFLVMSSLFSLYTSHFNTYNKMYGSLGTVILLLLYLYFFALAILLGAELNAMTGHHLHKPHKK